MTPTAPDFSPFAPGRPAGWGSGSGSGTGAGAVSAGGGATSSAGRLRDDAFELSTSLVVADSFATSIQPANRGRAPKALVLRSFRGPHLARDLARRLSREVRVL